MQFRPLKSIRNLGEELNMNTRVTNSTTLPFNLDAEDLSPLYMQIEKKIKAAIDSGDIKDGEPLPAERLIAESLNVSRVTVRKAIASLEQQHYCKRRRGSGTFASNPAAKQPQERLPQSLAKLRSFTEDMQEKGLNPSSKLVSSQLATANAEEVFSLNLKQQQVRRINRIRLSNDCPMSYDICSIPAQIFPQHKEIVGSVYKAMHAAGHGPVRAIQRITACALAPEIARLLEVDNGSAAMYVRRISYDKNEQAVEFTRSYYLADRFDFVAELWAES